MVMLLDTLKVSKANRARSGRWIGLQHKRLQRVSTATRMLRSHERNLVVVGAANPPLTPPLSPWNTHEHIDVFSTGHQNSGSTLERLRVGWVSG